MKCRYCFALCERGDICESCREDDAYDYAGVSKDEAAYEDAADRGHDEKARSFAEYLFWLSLASSQEWESLWN